jgi:hypothetical protein
MMDHLDELTVGPALKGNFDNLIEYLECGHAPTPEMCKVFLKVLTGELKRTRPKKGERGPVDLKARYRDIQIAAVIARELQNKSGWGDIGRAQRKVANELELKINIVRKAWKEQRPFLPHDSRSGRILATSLADEPHRIPLISGLAHGRCVYCPAATKELEQFQTEFHDVTCPHCRQPRGFPRFR